MLRNPLGSHLPVGRDLVAGALTTAREMGCEALQVFAGNPRGWAASAGRPEIDERFARACADDGLRTFVHAPYLVNPGSPTPLTFERSMASVAHNLVRAAQIGAEGVVMHTGSYVAAADGDAAEAQRRHEAALRQVHDGLMPVLDALPDDAPLLLLEPTAGQGRSLCAGVDGLPDYLAALEHHPKIGVCLDTCHVFAAGEPLDEPGGATAMLDAFARDIGTERLRLIHANDSRDPRGSLRDRHEQIGRGAIGTGAFAELLAHPVTAGVPLVLETPGSREPGYPDLDVLRDLRAQAAG